MNLLADIVIEMAPLAPWSALDLVKRNLDQRALKATLQAIIDEEISLVESTPLQFGFLQLLGERLYLADSGIRTRIVIFRALLGLLDPALCTPVLDWLETRDAYLSLQLRGWYLTESDPDVALALFAAAGLESRAQKTVIVRSAARFPDRALELYHQGEKGPEVLIEAIGAIAKRDPTRAHAIAETEPWKYRLDRWKALAEVAYAVAESDWQQSLDIIQPISDDHLRSTALSHIVAVLPENLPPGAIDLVITRLTAEAGALLYPDNRLYIYEALIGFLQATPLLSPNATATLIEAIGRGDSGVFLQLLPDLIRLVCKGEPRMPFRLEAEPGIIETLLDA